MQRAAMLTFFVHFWTKWSRNLEPLNAQHKVFTPFCPRKNKKCHHSSILRSGISTNECGGCCQPFNRTPVIIQNEVAFRRQIMMWKVTRTHWTEPFDLETDEQGTTSARSPPAHTYKPSSLTARSTALSRSLSQSTSSTSTGQNSFRGFILQF